MGSFSVGVIANRFGRYETVFILLCNIIGNMQDLFSPFSPSLAKKPFSYSLSIRTVVFTFRAVLWTLSHSSVFHYIGSVHFLFGTAEPSQPITVNGSHEACLS